MERNHDGLNRAPALPCHVLRRGVRGVDGGPNIGEVRSDVKSPWCERSHQCGNSFSEKALSALAENAAGVPAPLAPVKAVGTVSGMMAACEACQLFSWADVQAHNSRVRITSMRRACAPCPANSDQFQLT